MKIRIGHMETVHGTIETSPNGLLYTAEAPWSEERLRNRIEGMRWTWPDTGERASDEDVLASLPARMRGPYSWATVLDGHAMTRREYSRALEESGLRAEAALKANGLSALPWLDRR